MELSVQNLFGLVIRSRLLTAPEAQAMFKRWQTEAKDSNSDTARFAKWMVGNGFVTEYQASLLARGRFEGFFLGEYKILDRIGRGRMAGVYRAVHPLGQTVAIKVLPPSKAKDPHLFGRFQREARLASRLKHPNIVGTFQVGEAGGIHYLVMEHLEGETLEDALQRRGKLPPEEAVRIVYQALKGLQYIHEQGLVHRDLKPANLILLPQPSEHAGTTLGSRVKILDIGLARFEIEEAPPVNSGEPELTTEGILLGTPDYMSPEQARDARSVDIRSDIYSLGCVLFHTLTGQPPFPDSNIISQMIRHASEPAKPLKDFNPAVPDGLQQILNWMMAKEPGKRYPTPERAAQALEVYLLAGGEAIGDVEIDPKMKSYLQWLEKSDQATVDLASLEPPTKNATIRLSQRSDRKTPAQEIAAVPVDNALAIKKKQPSPVLTSEAPSLSSSKSKPKEERPDRAPPKMRLKQAPKPGRLEGETDQPAPAAVGRPAKSLEEPVHEVRAETAQPHSLLPDYDVELIAAAPANKPAPFSLSNPRLARRDFIMFAVGGATVLLALALGKVLSILFPRRRQDSLTEQGENDLEGSQK
jgi:serine/threonine protein kinase